MKDFALKTQSASLRNPARIQKPTIVIKKKMGWFFFTMQYFKYVSVNGNKGLPIMFIYYLESHLLPSKILFYADNG